MRGHERRLTVLRWILGASIVSTALHYTHNFVAIDQYPPAGGVSDGAVRIAIVVSWPLLTALALVAYRRYAQGRYAIAHPLLAAYSLLGLTTPLHFTEGNPDIAPLWYATIFTDGLAGAAVLAFAVWSAVTVRRAPVSA
jgi:hypothetical protein